MEKDCGVEWTRKVGFTWGRVGARNQKQRASVAKAIALRPLLTYVLNLY